MLKHWTNLLAPLRFPVSPNHPADSALHDLTTQHAANVPLQKI